MIKESEIVNKIIEEIENMDDRKLLETYNQMFGTALTLTDVHWDETGEQNGG